MLIRLSAVHNSHSSMSLLQGKSSAKHRSRQLWDDAPGASFFYVDCILWLGKPLTREIQPVLLGRVGSFLGCLDPHSVRFVFVCVWSICALLWQLHKRHHKKLQFHQWIQMNKILMVLKELVKCKHFSDRQTDRVGFGTKLVQAHFSYPGDVSV